MSACISRSGEFSEHSLDESHTCTRCHVLDEEALRAEVEQLRAALAVAAGEFRRARQATRRLTAVLTANAPRLDVPFTNAEGSPWELHVKPAMYALREALGIRFWQPETAEPSGTEAGR